LSFHTFTHHQQHFVRRSSSCKVTVIVTSFDLQSFSRKLKLNHHIVSLQIDIFEKVFQMKRLTSTERQGFGGNRSRGSGGSDRSLGRPPVRSGSQLSQSAPVLSASFSREESAGLVTAPNVNLSSNFDALNLSGQSSSNEQLLPPYGVRDVRAAWNQTIQNFTAATQASEASGDVPQRQLGLLPERQEPADEQPPYVPPPISEESRRKAREVLERDYLAYRAEQGLSPSNS
jgi:hypothetical protein